MKTTIILQNDADALDRSINTIRSGKILAFPTDTVYGIGVSAFDPEGITKLFEVKGRDSNKAIAVLLADISQLATVCTSIPEYATRLGNEYWPGALTLVLPRNPTLPEILSPLPTVGVRIPDYDFVRKLIRACGPLAVTSANRSGLPSATSPKEVVDQLDGLLDLVVDGGISPGGVPSTVVDCTGNEFKVLRIGAIKEEMIKMVIR